MAIELWKDIPGYEGRYQVSNLGRVKSLHYKRSNFARLLASVANRNGYCAVNLRDKDGRKKLVNIHRLVGAAFVPNADNKPQLNHINGNKKDNRAENLEWCTASENQSHSIKTGLRETTAVLQCSESGDVLNVWESVASAARSVGCTHMAIIRCCKGQIKSCKGYIWKYKEVVCNG